MVDGERNKTSRVRGGAEGGEHTSLWDRPGFLVRRLHQIHVAIFLEECAADNITPVQYGLLSVLMEEGERDQATLAEEVGIDRTNVADVLERLERRGLLTRVANPRDKRMRVAHLTDKGRAFVRKNRNAMQRAQEKMLAPLSEADRHRFRDLLRLLVEANNKLGRAPMRPRK